MKKIIPVLLFFMIILIEKNTGQNVEFTRQDFPHMRNELRQALRDLREGDRQYYEAENLRKYREDRERDSHLGRQMYLYALEEYEKAFAFNPANAYLNFKMGVCYLNTIEKTKAIPYFERAYELDPSIDDNIYLYMAQAYHLNYEFEKAINMFNKHRGTLTRLQLTREGWNNILDAMIQQCINGIELMESPVDVEIIKLDSFVNSEFPDYNPIVTADERMLVFTSRRGKESEIRRHVDPYDYVEDIYISYNMDGEWTPAINPGEPLNSDRHEASVGISPDGSRMYIYKGDDGGNLYESNYTAGKWTRPTRLPPPLNSDFYEGSASFSPDGRTVYFVSERPGGRGGTDIYMATMNRRGEWGRAQNLGRVVNTEFDERGVFMHPDGVTLYFSSQGHNSMGGFDIFKTQRRGRRGWTEPVNLGYPINTPEDDMFFSVTANGRHGYFSSSKEGTHNIYKIIFKDAVNLLTLVKGYVLDEKTQEPISAEIEIVNLATNEDIANFHSDEITGSYLVSLPSGVNYGVSVKADGYLFYSENFNVDSTAEYREIDRNIYLQRIQVGSIVVLNNIFFEFAKATLTAESTNELDRIVQLLKENPRISVEISGHTDNIGSAAYNKELSTERAKAVVDYLISKGVKPSRLTYKGYGFEKPIASNETEEGRQMNRRTEFKIIDSD